MYVDLVEVLSSFYLYLFFINQSFINSANKSNLIGSFLLNNFSYEFLTTTLNNKTLFAA